MPGQSKGFWVWRPRKGESSLCSPFGALVLAFLVFHPVGPEPRKEHLFGLLLLAWP